MVSILVPVYNAAPYLRECVASLTGQTYSDLQIVLINDGSTDDSYDILLELQRQDKRIEVYSQANSGVAATRSHLLDKAKGDFVLFVDSDDWIELNTIERLMHEQQQDDYDVVSFQLGTPRGNQNNAYNREQIIKLFLEHITFRGSLCDKLIRRELFDNVEIDKTVSYGEDALIVWQVLLKADRVRVLNDELYHYRVNENSLSRQPFNGKKFSAYTTWDRICRDTEESWPRYKDISRARFACEMTQILRDAAAHAYPHNSHVRLLQEEVRRDGHLISETGISSKKMSAYAWLVSHNYWLACRLSRFIG